MSEITIDKFAPDATTQDLRVQTLAYTDASLSTNFAVEDRSMVDVVNIGVAAGQQRKVEMETGEVAGFPAIGEDALRQAEVEFVAIRDDVSRTDDQRAASDILAFRTKEQLIAFEEARRRQPTRYAKSAQIFNSFRLIRRPQEASGSFEKLNRYSNVQEQKNTYLAARFAAVLSFSDKLGLKEQGAPKQLSGPIQAKTSYANLP